MLVLTRKLGQEILIGGNIKIAVVEIRGGQVRIGVTAPPETRVLRGELAARDGGGVADGKAPR